MTDIEICNLALDNISVTNKITALSASGTKEERACTRWYALMRDLVLRQFPWPFAASSAELVLNEVETDLQWSFLFDAPADLLKPRRLFVPGARRNVYPKLPFAIVRRGASVLVGCDAGMIALEYTRTFETADKINTAPQEYVDALSWKLAARLVKPLSLDASLIGPAEGMYTALVRQAFASEVETFQPDQPPDAEWIEERG